MSKQLLSIQYLRAVASIMVVFYHARYYLDDKDLADILFKNAALGVDLFFVISGFIICVSTDNKIETFRVFFIKRVFRIYPILVAFILLLFAINTSYGILIKTNISELVNINIIESIGRSLIPLHADYDDQAPWFGYNYLYTAWTLTYEIMFYLVFLFSILISYKNRVALAFFTIVICFIIIQIHFTKSVTFNAYANVSINDTKIIKPILSVLSSPMMIEFIYGMIIFIIYKHMPSFKNDISNKLFGFIMLLSVPIFILFYYLSVAYGHGPLKWGLICAYLVLSLALYEKFNKVKHVNIFMLLGNLSYSIYLIHPVVILCLPKLVSKWISTSSWIYIILIVTTTIISSYLSYILIERPMIKAGSKIVKKLQA